MKKGLYVEKKGMSDVGGNVMEIGCRKVERGRKRKRVKVEG